MLHLDAVRSGKKTIPDPPEWFDVILLAEQLGKMPSEIDNEPMEWIVKLSEYHYLAGMGAKRDN